MFDLLTAEEELDRNNVFDIDGVLPLALSSLGGKLAHGSLVLAVTPALIAGVLFLASAHFHRGGSSTPRSRPKDRLGVS